MWEVRRALGEMLCPDDPVDCPEVDTGGFKVITTIDLKMQKTAEKWVYVAARAPNAKNPSAILSSRKIPGSARSWIMGLRGHNIHNAAAGVIDYRTGEVLAYAGSASYTSKGNKKFQPQFDVLADGWRQPGSAIKPIDYAIGIDDKTLTAATMFMDVTTNFGGGFTPTQADKLERGPVRLRSALQFSLNIPAIKATIMSGLDHIYERTKEFGLTLSEDRAARPVDGHRHPRGPSDRPARRATARSPTTACACRAGSSARSSTTTAPPTGRPPRTRRRARAS